MNLSDELDAINMLWVGASLGYMERQCIGSFLTVGHPVNVFCYGDLAGIPAGATKCDAAEILPESEVFTYTTGSGKGSPAAFANLFRYKLLYMRGGWWSDTDVFCLRPWIFNSEHVFVSEPGNAKLVHNGIIRAPKGSDVMLRAYTHAATADRATLRWGQTGSRLLTQLSKKMPIISRSLWPSVTFCPLPWQNVDKIIRSGKLPPEAAISHGVHLFREMWNRHALDKEFRWPIYNQLASLQHAM